MSRNPDAFADMVVLTVKAALVAPLERIAVLEQQNRDLLARLTDLVTLRDRVTAVETKSDVPVPVASGITPELELVIRDRMDPLTKQVSGLSERLAVMEVRAPVPGPAGPAGLDGKDGKDGADGLGFDDMSVEFDGDRTLALKFERGSKVKTWPIPLPYLRYEGVYQEGKSYDVGDLVTWGGSMHYCREATIDKPGQSKAWQLCVKQGRDGKDGRDAPVAPVVKVS